MIPPPGERATLRAAGVRVRSGLGAVAALDLNRRWFDAVAAKRPFVTLHIAQTLDSRIAASDGTSQWISSPESLADNHALRGRIDAILVGHADGPGRQPAAHGADPATASARQAAAAGRHGPAPDSRRRRRQRRRRQGAAPGHPDPGEALDELFDAGVRHLMVEGGSRILSAFLRGRPRR